MMTIKFIAEDEIDSLMKGYHSPYCSKEIIFKTDTAATVEELNDLYTRFLIAIGYDIKQDNKEVDNG